MLLPDAVRQLWQLRVDGRTVLSREQVAAAYHARAVPGGLLYLVFTGVGVICGGIGLGACVQVLRPRRDQAGCAGLSSTAHTDEAPRLHSE
jgi:hypothetical protein